MITTCGGNLDGVLAMTAKRRKSVGTIFADDRSIDAAVRAAAREALRRHQRVGLTVVVWRNGQSVWVPPEKTKSRRASSTPPCLPPDTAPLVI